MFISDPERWQMFTPPPPWKAHTVSRAAKRTVVCLVLLLTGLWQRSSHFVLGGVNVTGGPAALGPESRQSLDQNLQADRRRLNPTAEGWGTLKRTARRSRCAEKSHSSLGGDVSAAHDFGAGQRFLALRSLPERDQSWHIWKARAREKEEKEEEEGGAGSREAGKEKKSETVVKSQHQTRRTLSNVGRDGGGSQMASQMSQTGRRSLPAETYPARLSRSRACQTRPAWCSSHRSRCCPWSWPESGPAARSRRRSCRCRTRLRVQTHA